LASKGQTVFQELGQPLTDSTTPASPSTSAEAPPLPDLSLTTPETKVFRGTTPEMLGNDYLTGKPIVRKKNEAQGVGETISAVGGEAYKAVAGITNLVDFVQDAGNDAFNQILVGRENAVKIKEMRDKGNLPDALGGNTLHPFEDITNVLNDWANKTSKPLQSGIGGQIAKGTIDVIPDIITAYFAPEIGVPKIISQKLGIDMLSKFGIVMGTKSAIQGAEGAQNESTFRKFEMPILGAIEGYVMGSTYEGMGGASSRFGRKIADKLIPKVTSTTGAINKAIVEQGSASLSDVVIFGGYANADEFLRTGKISAETFATNAGIGLAFRGKDIGKLLWAKGINSFISAPREMLKNVSDANLKTEDLAKTMQEKIDAIEKGDSPNREGDLAVAKMNANLAGLNEVISHIKENKTEVIKDVQEGTLDPKVKELVVDKINEVDADNDPKIQATKDITDKISKIDDALELIRNNKSWDETRKEVESAPLKERKLSLKEEANKVYGIEPKETPKGEDGKVKEKPKAVQTEASKKTLGELDGFKLGDKVFADKKELTDWLDKNYNEKDRLESVNGEGYLEGNTMKVFNEWYKANKNRLSNEELERIDKELQDKAKVAEGGTENKPTETIIPSEDKPSEVSQIKEENATKGEEVKPEDVQCHF
jgi:hypothetical protein